MYIDFLLIHVFSIEQDRFISGSLELHSFMNWFLLPLYHLTLMSFCTKGIHARSCRIHSHHIMRGAGGIGQGSNVYHNISIIVLYGIHGFSFNVFFLQKRVELNAEISMEGFFLDASSATSWAVIGAPINPR